MKGRGWAKASALGASPWRKRWVSVRSSSMALAPAPEAAW